MRCRSGAGSARASLGEVRPPSIGLTDRGGQGRLGVPPSEGKEYTDLVAYLLTLKGGAAKK